MSRGAPHLNARSERGFAFLIVLLVLTISTIVIGVGLERTTFRARLVERQLDEYRRHHEMLSVRDTVFTWMSRADAAQVAAIAAQGESAQRIELEGGVIYLMTIRDGQGTIRMAPMEEIERDEDREWLLGAISRLPADRISEFTRRAGPLAISLPGAPDAVLYAAAGDDLALADALIKARDQEVNDAASLMRHLDRSGIEPEVAQAVTRRFVFQPGLWRFNVEVFHPEEDHKTRRYSVLAEFGNIPRLHEWRALPG